MLRGATLSVGPGEATLLRIIDGLLRRDRGSITIQGQHGECPQDPLLSGRLTLEENTYQEEIR